VMRNTKLDSQAIEEKRAVLLKRLEEKEQDRRETLMEMLHMTAFQGNPMAMSPDGNDKTIKSITREQISNFADDHYKPVRMVLTGVGGVDHAKLEGLAQKYFGDLDNQYKRQTATQGSVRFTGSEFLYRDDNIPYAYGAVAVEGVPRGHLDELALKIGSMYVGGWDRSQAASHNYPNTLAQEVTGNHEIEAFNSFSLNYANAGLFGVSVVCHGEVDEPIAEFMASVLDQWKRLCYGVTEEELDRAKNALKTNLFEQLESNTGLANHTATEVLATGKMTPLHVLERKIHYTDASAVREAMSRHIYDRDVAVAGLGKTEAWTQYYMLRSAMSWWRL